MPKTVAEILKETGLTDEQIAAIDPKAIQGLTSYATQANDALTKAEEAVRLQRHIYDTEVAPALDKWSNEKASQDAENAAMRAALKAAEESGFKLPAILSTPATPATPGTPAKDANGRFVANTNTTPGSPSFDPGKLKSELTSELGAAFSFATDTQWKYRTLFGKEMPDSPTSIIREATAARMSPAEFAAKKYGFSEREAAMKADEQKKHDDAIRAEATAERDKHWAEKVGSNPDVRMAQESSFTAVSKAVQAGARKDPLKLTPEERKANTHSTIAKDIAERSSMVQ